MGITSAIAALLIAAVVIGALRQALNNPSGANTVMFAGADVIDGAVHGLEGK